MPVLSGMILRTSTKEPDVIGPYYNEDASATTMMGLLLKNAGVPVETGQEYELLGVADHNSEKKHAICVRGAENIESYKRKGGVIVEPGSLSAYTFKYKPVMAQLRLEARDQIPAVQKIFDKQGIKYRLVAGVLEVPDATSQCAIALSGGRFNGSHDLLKEQNLLWCLTH